MADIYESKVAKLFGLIFGKGWNSRYAITTGKDTTRWSVTEAETMVSHKNPDNPLAWRRHEDCHKKQWAKHGRIMFVTKYLWYQIRYGYQRNPFEIQARLAEK